MSIGAEPSVNLKNLVAWLLSFHMSIVHAVSIYTNSTYHKIYVHCHTSRLTAYFYFKLHQSFITGPQEAMGYLILGFCEPIKSRKQEAHGPHR